MMPTFRLKIIFFCWAFLLPFDVVHANNDACYGAKTENSLLICRQQEYAKSEATLKNLLNSLSANYEREEPKQLLLLSESQSKWLAYRDAECLLITFESSAGSAYEVYKLDCLNKLNLKRIEDLKLLQSSP